MTEPTVEQLEKILILIGKTWPGMRAGLLHSSPTEHDRIIDYYLSDSIHADTLIELLNGPYGTPPHDRS